MNLTPEQAAKLPQLVNKTVDVHIDCTVLDGCDAPLSG